MGDLAIDLDLAEVNTNSTDRITEETFDQRMWMSGLLTGCTIDADIASNLRKLIVKLRGP